MLKICKIISLIPCYQRLGSWFWLTSLSSCPCMKKDLVCINVGRHFGWETKRTKSHMWDGIDDKKSSWAVCLENEIIFHHRMDFAKHITRFFGETGMLWLPAGPACHRPAWLPLHTLMLYTTYIHTLSAFWRPEAGSIHHPSRGAQRAE